MTSAWTYGFATEESEPSQDGVDVPSLASARFNVFPESLFPWIMRFGIDEPTSDAFRLMVARRQFVIGLGERDGQSRTQVEGFLSLAPRQWVTHSPCLGWRIGLSEQIDAVRAISRNTPPRAAVTRADELFVPYQEAVAAFLSGDAESAREVAVAPVAPSIKSGAIMVHALCETLTVDFLPGGGHSSS